MPIGRWSIFLTVLRRSLTVAGWALSLAAIPLLVLSWGDSGSGMDAFFAAFLTGITLRWAGNKARPGLVDLAIGGAFLGSLALFLFADLTAVWPVIAASGIWITFEDVREATSSAPAETPAV